MTFYGTVAASITVAHDLSVSKAVKARKSFRQRPPIIRLNAEESRRLVDALLAPPRPPTAAMKRGMKQYRETVISDVNPNSAALLAKFPPAIASRKLTSDKPTTR